MVIPNGEFLLPVPGRVYDPVRHGKRWEGSGDFWTSRVIQSSEVLSVAGLLSTAEALSVAFVSKGDGSAVVSDVDVLDGIGRAVVSRTGRTSLSEVHSHTLLSMAVESAGIAGC